MGTVKRRLTTWLVNRALEMDLEGERVAEWFLGLALVDDILDLDMFHSLIISCTFIFENGSVISKYKFLTIFIYYGLNG